MPINRECPKCGDDRSTVWHNTSMDQLELKCILCRYEWTSKPLDVLRADKERTAAGKTVSKGTIMAKTITQDQYYQLVGLAAAAKHQIDVLKAMEKAALAITDERDHEGNPHDCGHTTDIVWASRDLDEGLRIMEIEVAK
jgi:Zn ribbon nucleic-acid-binding protein